MSMFETIKAQQLEARKAGKKARASLLTTILGEFARARTQETPTDEQVFKVVQAVRNGVQETYEKQATPELEYELTVLDSLLQMKPAMATDEEVEAALVEHLAAYPEDKNIGACMKFLKAKFGSTLDGGSANGLVRSIIAR